jgi:hypothetical protein
MGADPLTATVLGLSLASAGVDIAGKRSEARFAERRSKLNARVGEIRANELDAAFRDELDRTLNNIDSIRASAGVSSLSPTAAAIRERERTTSDRNRTSRVRSEEVQAEQSRQDARFFRSSARSALLGGIFRSLPRFLSLGGSFSGGGGNVFGGSGPVNIIPGG